MDSSSGVAAEATGRAAAEMAAEEKVEAEKAAVEAAAAAANSRRRCNPQGVNRNHGILGKNVA